MYRYTFSSINIFVLSETLFEINLTVPKTECGMVDLCVVLDSSGSIKDRNPTDGSYDNWELILSFVKGVA